MERVRFGIIGVGNMGTIHSTYLNAGEIEGAILSAVCDLKEDRRKWAKENLAETVTIFTDYKEMTANLDGTYGNR